MNRITTCMLAAALALSLSPAAVAQDEAPAAESKPVPLAGVDPAEYVDLLAEGKNGDILGIVFDVVLDDSGKATTIVLELFAEEAEGEVPEEGEGELAAEDTEEEEPEALPNEDDAADDAAEGEGTDEPVPVGKLVGVAPKGAMMDTGRDLVMLPSVTGAQARGMDEFTYESGMKTVSHPDGYSEEAAGEAGE